MITSSVPQSPASNSFGDSSDMNILTGGITSHQEAVTIFNTKFISSFDSKAAGAGMTISMLLDNYFEFNLTSDARWNPKDSSSQTKMTKVYKYALKDNSILKKKMADLYEAMPDKNADNYEAWKEEWRLAKIAAEDDVNSRLCAEESEYSVELKTLADARELTILIKNKKRCQKKKEK